MLTPPDLSQDAIAQCLADEYGLHAIHAEFLPLGADVNSSAFRVHANNGSTYFLKLRQGDFTPTAVFIPLFLHHEQSIDAVMTALPTTGGQPSAQSLGFDWMLYPFFKGDNGFKRPLSNAQWIALGAALSAVHRADLPDALRAGVPQESYSHHWREGVRRYQRRFINGLAGDDIVRRFLAFWEAHDEEIDTIVYRSEQLASILLEKQLPLVLCHSDIHAGNVLVGDDDRLCIVDWDTLVLAPKERDLMFIGGGVGNVWNQPQEEALFYQGYGPVDIDPVALAYYRYERITRDLLEICDQIFDTSASLEDREEGLRQMENQFLPDDVVAIAHRSYETIT
ncbi:aminoglycoside phosphotransferase family protein [Variovorax sp. EL159]|uniref:aminoglycoside phosphotransferase family protein n=1 Tax=Variovorax sp. EL159 TaxID=1566270 RepID=UPI00088D5E04|nr:aminoglycoside phosphotransferase family protein [Variovorax sp. EL159]SCX46029.1 spectinomycin phosphotransferase [Variovorax sp. EL159]